VTRSVKGTLLASGTQRHRHGRAASSVNDLGIYRR